VVVNGGNTQGMSSRREISSPLLTFSLRRTFLFLSLFCLALFRVSFRSGASVAFLICYRNLSFFSGCTRHYGDSIYLFFLWVSFTVCYNGTGGFRRLCLAVFLSCCYHLLLFGSHDIVCWASSPAFFFFCCFLGCEPSPGSVWISHSS